MSARLRPPVRPDPTHPATPGRAGPATLSLYRSRKIRNVPSLAFELTQLLAVCDARGLPRPAELAGLNPRFPCRVVLAERRHPGTGKRTGCLQLCREDGTSFFEHEWRVAAASSPPAPPAPPGPRRIGVAMIGELLSGKPLFMVTALHPEPGAGGEIVYGTTPAERGFTEEKLRLYLAAAHGMSEADITGAVQAAKARAAAPE